MLMMASTMATTIAGHSIFWIMPHIEKSSLCVALSPWNKKKASLLPASQIFVSSIGRNPPISI